MWIERTYEVVIRTPPPSLQLFPVWLILGPRQVGKSSLLHRCATPDRQIVDFDDLAVRGRAAQDPLLFAASLRPPLLLDEIQYAPALLSVVKRFADQNPGPGAIWLTGSQSFEVMQGVRETLAGRVAILNLFGLSDEEKRIAPATPDQYFAALWQSSFPKLAGVSDAGALDLYYSSYLQTYIERDVRELLGIQKRREFEVFVRMCALRTAQVVNYDDLARDARISPVTAKDWLGLLEDSFLIRLIHPYHSNRSKRLIKSPKLYFLDAGLAAWLAGWRDAESLRLGPLGGAILETHVFGQLLRYFRHRAREVDITFWRTRDGEEIDFLVEAGGRVTPVEVNLGTPDARRLPRLEKIAERSWQPGRVLSLTSLGSGTEREPWAGGWQAASPIDLTFLEPG